MMVSVHLLSSLLSYVAFLIAFVSGIGFLLQERQLKHKRMGKLFHWLPALDVLDRINFVAIGIGFLLLSLGMACGAMEAATLFGRWWPQDAKTYLTAGLWGVYCLLWMLRLRATLRGRRVALLSILGFSLVLFTFVGASWFSSRHPYL